MLTILITASREERTLGRAIAAFLAQDLGPDWELLVVCPDEPTAAVAAQCAVRTPQVRVLRDEGKGKPAALNLGLGAAQGGLAPGP